MEPGQSRWSQSQPGSNELLLCRPRPRFILRVLLAALLLIVTDAVVIPLVFPEHKELPFLVAVIGGPSIGLAS